MATGHTPPPHQGAAALSQEDMILAQAKGNLSILEPRLQITRECLETLEDAVAGLSTTSLDSTVTLIAAIIKVQLIQLRSALKEGELNADQYRQVIADIESPSKIFRPAGYPPYRPTGHQR